MLPCDLDPARGREPTPRGGDPTGVGNQNSGSMGLGRDILLLCV